MRIWLVTTTLLLSFVASASEICATIEASPETEQGKVLYAKYREKGLHLHSFPTWSGEGFYSVGSNEKYNFAISEVYWGSSCRVTRKLYVYDLGNKILGYYGNLSNVPKPPDLAAIQIGKKWLLDGEHYDWHSI